MKLTQNILCVIGARGGSKGVKNKNIMPIAGKPLLAHTIIQALQSRLFSHIVLSTDSEDIAKVGEEYGAEVFFLRDKALATDDSGKLPAIRDALLRSEAHYKTHFDVIFDLDATSPLRLVSDITQAYEQFLHDDNDILITASPARKSPYFNLIEIFEEEGEKRVNLSKKPPKPILRRQDSPKCYDMNASIYIWKREALLENDSVFTPNTGLFIMPEERSIDIDTPLDFAFVDFMLNHANKQQIRGGVVN
ncbi:acylneuraminate cytidylyltransferase family protein [uncultured Helicobacter sp.]|uniref:acylneuraminate cytidylyltransferase family protein n=1 Tax=uncultured Helicobacter sp. TaxID=175537 RepID=UPI00262B10D3|nr:acylneuraminate cytidylyltransferase family protein [uncultured Helicobacter sp.]